MRLFFILLVFSLAHSASAVLPEINDNSIFSISSSADASINTSNWYLIKNATSGYYIYYGQSGWTLTKTAPNSNSSITTWKSFLFEFSSSSNGKIKAGNGMYMASSDANSMINLIATTTQSSAKNVSFRISNKKCRFLFPTSYAETYSPYLKELDGVIGLGDPYYYSYQNYDWYLIPVNVSTPVNHISLDKTSVNLYPKEVQQLTATITPSEASNKNVLWSSSNESVVSVSTTGEITAHKPGDAVVTAMSVSNNAITASCEVTVPFMAGDVNYDQMVCIVDIVLTINHILGDDSSMPLPPNMNMDDDDIISENDVRAIVSKALNEKKAHYVR